MLKINWTLGVGVGSKIPTPTPSKNFRLRNPGWAIMLGGGGGVSPIPSSYQAGS